MGSLRARKQAVDCDLDTSAGEAPAAQSQAGQEQIGPEKGPTLGLPKSWA